MVVGNTETMVAFDNDTYRGNEQTKKVNLKIRIAPEYTGEGNSSKDSAATANLTDNSPYRLTSQFGRKFLRIAPAIPSVIDDLKQRFSGVVIRVAHESEEFDAQIVDLTEPGNPDEFVTLSFDEIEEADRRQLTIGDSFVWYIGYVQGQLVSREGFSKIRFRRFSVWTQKEIDAASNKAKELADFFQRNSDTST